MATTPLGLSSSTGYRDRLTAHVRSRRTNERATIENPLAHLTDQELEADVRRFVQQSLPSVDYDSLLRAARVGKDVRLYDEAARRPAGYDERNRLLVTLTEREKRALRKEKDNIFSEKGMLVVILTVSLAAFLQGFVQSSFNGASLYKSQFGLSSDDDWKLGAANASPWFFAAFIGCPLSLPINYWFGRRGGISVAAFMIFCSSIAAIFATSWTALFGVRIINGIGMGIKAVSTPILASETSVGFWRGSAILAWQLWVAFGIMVGFGFNLLFTTATSTTTFRLIQGAPLVPSFALLLMAMFVCPESPRYHLLKGPNYSVEEAFRVLKKLRNTELQALRDMYLVHKSIENEKMDLSDLDPHSRGSPGFSWVLRDFLRQYTQLFRARRLRNAVISTSTVNLAQQLCGVNVCAFYSGTIFNDRDKDNVTIPMAYSFGFGAINFLFALPAIKSIDTIGRRRLLLLTLPFMAIFMLGAAMSAYIKNKDSSKGVTACFLFLFSAAYSPGQGPIPFTLASESFPLTHREAGTAWAISINLLFAGLLALSFPRIQSSLHQDGSLGLFAGLNIVAFIMVFLFVEETKQRSLEELDHIFAVSKRKFIQFQTMTYLPWAIRKYIFGRSEGRPELYKDLVWGSVSEPVQLKRTPVGDTSYHIDEEYLELPQTRMPRPKLSSFERPMQAELEEMYPPGVDAPYPRDYPDGRSPTVRIDNDLLGSYRSQRR